METLSATAFRAYRGLVYETPGFEDYFWNSTVITEIATRQHRQPSRIAQEDPQHRGSPGHPLGVQLGPVPADAARLVRLPHRCKAWLEDHPNDGLARLQAMNRDWPFFRTLLSNMDMVLSKSNIAIASRYADLVPDVELRNAIFPRIRQEWRRHRPLLAITGQSRLLESNPLLERSIRNRFPTSTR